jgi:hypothetical protein
MQTELSVSFEAAIDTAPSLEANLRKRQLQAKKRDITITSTNQKTGFLPQSCT